MHSYLIVILMPNVTRQLTITASASKPLLRRYLENPLPVLKDAVSVYGRVTEWSTAVDNTPKPFADVVTPFHKNALLCYIRDPPDSDFVQIQILVSICCFLVW